MKTRLALRLPKKLLSILASLAFFVGSTLFLPVFADYSTVGVWAFMTGSALMLVDVLCAA